MSNAHFASTLIHYLSLNKIDFFLLCIATRWVIRSQMLVFVLPDQLTFAQLFEVSVVLPKLEVVAFSLESSNLVKDTEVCSAIFRAELLWYLLEQEHLVWCQEFAIYKLVEILKRPVLLNRRS